MGDIFPSSLIFGDCFILCLVFVMIENSLNTILILSFWKLALFHHNFLVWLRRRLDHDQKKINAGDQVLLVIRPETISLSSSKGTERPNTFHGTVESHMYAGNLAQYTVGFGE